MAQTALASSCVKLIEALNGDSDQVIAESIAMVYYTLNRYMDEGTISYEAIDDELLRLSKEEEICEE